MPFNNYLTDVPPNQAKLEGPLSWMVSRAFKTRRAALAFSVLFEGKIYRQGLFHAADGKWLVRMIVTEIPDFVDRKGLGIETLCNRDGD